MTRTLAALLVTGVLAITGCGSDGPRLDADASVELTTHVEAVRTAAANRDRAGAEAALAALIDRLGALRDEGRVSDEAAIEIRAEADRVLAALAAIPTTTTTTTTAPPPDDDKGDEEKDDDEKGDDEKGNGGEGGRGNGGDG